MRTRRLMIRPTAQYGGIRFLCQIGGNLAMPAHESRNTPARFGYAGDTYALAAETVDGTVDGTSSLFRKKSLCLYTIESLLTCRSLPTSVVIDNKVVSD